MWEEDYDKGRDGGGCGRKIMTRGGVGEGVGGRVGEWMKRQDFVYK